MTDRTTASVLRHRVTDAVDIVVTEHRAALHGPTLTVFGGVHGDEFEGRLAAAILTERLGPRLDAGVLRVVAAANPLAARSRTRSTVEDGKNLARSFPGSLEGSITEQVAWVLTNRVIEGSDVLVDLHSAGEALSMPLMIGYAQSQVEACLPLAEAFGAPLIWEHDAVGPGRSITVAAEMGASALYVECSGGGSIRQAELAALIEGVERIARRMGLILGDAAPPSAGARIIRGGDGNLDASLNARSSGWVVLHVQAGQQVKPGQIVLDIRDAAGMVIDEMRAHAHGTVMALRRYAVVEEGDLLAMLGPPAH